MVFLDWAKAFDRMKTDTLLVALTRFGFPSKVVNIIGAIYRERRFFVQDHSGKSSLFSQRAGIAQGCPLSPFLFIVVQSVMFHDIQAKLELEAEPLFVVTRELLYADDTVLMSSSQRNLQQLIDAVAAEGATYGLEINWDKTFQMSICTGSAVHRPDGTELERKREIVYLGGLITSDGRVSRELSRRVGEGRSILNKLRQL